MQGLELKVNDLHVNIFNQRVSPTLNGWRLSFTLAIYEVPQLSSIVSYIP